MSETVEVKMAPVQGYTPGIPWSMHLEAYDVYRKKYGAQQALIEGWCRGGFGAGELDEFIPGWRDKVSEIGKLRAEIERLQSELSIQWPKQREVGRIGDMSPVAHMRVGLDTDNDVYVSVWDEEAGATIEFCAPGAGGGKSSRTREALIRLMVAIEKDNAETPALDWWARRMSAAKT